MTDKSSEGRPRVTFALFAYNQETYIREAIEFALAQTYQPLEIILSDDCSADRTFEIMQEMAAAYNGPHDVRLRQSEINLGTALHVYAVASQSKGELLVVAAGDDVSLPERTELLVRAWEQAGKPVATIHSNLAIISDRGLPETPAKPRVEPGTELTLDWYIEHARIPYLPPTSAYSISLFTDLGPMFGGSIIEDGVLAVRCFLHGTFIYVDSVLVRQRIVPEASGRGHSLRTPYRWNRLIRSQIISAGNSLHDLSVATVPEHKKRELESFFLGRARKLSKYFIPENRALNSYEKALLFVRLAFGFPSTEPFRKKLMRATVVLELHRHPITIRVRKVFRSG